MPTELQIIRSQEFIRLGAQGHFDLKASQAVLTQLAGACCKRGINQAMLDLRALHPGPKPVFSPNDLVKLVNTFKEAGFTRRQRLAVLYGSDPHHRARLFSFIATLRGWNVRAFDDFEKAVIWLSHGEVPQVEAESTTRSKKIPVRQFKALKAKSKNQPIPQPKIILKSSGVLSSSEAGNIPVKTGKLFQCPPAALRLDSRQRAFQRPRPARH